MSLPKATQYRGHPEQAISCAVREGNGKCVPHSEECGNPHVSSAELPGQIGSDESPNSVSDAGSRFSL